MLSKQAVVNLISDGIIGISYSFSDIDGNVKQYSDEQFVQPGDLQAVGTKMFERNFKADRLSITMGAVVVSHSVKRHKGRVNFRSKPYNFDLLQTNNEIEILPNETISICSNERIRIQGNYGAYILPRLTSADAGLFYFPSYIDPYWDGLMQAVLHNFSTDPIRIRICERLAICRFYELQGIVDEDFKKTFPATTHHFGQNWPGIFDGSREPVRRGKEPSHRVSRWDLSQATKTTVTFLKNNFTTLLTGGLIVIVGSVFIAFKNVLFEFPELKEKVKLVSRIPDSGEIVLTMDKGDADGIYKETVNRAIRNIQTIWTDPTEGADLIQSISTSKREIDLTKTEITFIVKMKQPLRARATVRLKYMLVD